MISYKCADAKISSRELYPTFTRMEPPDTQVTSSVLSLLEYHKWKKFSIIYQEGAQWETIAKYLQNQATKKGFHLNHYVKFKDQLSCCISGDNECCSNMWPHPILKKTKDSTRIYVFLGKKKMLEQFMNQMKVEQLFAEGKYMVIYLTPDTAVYNELASYLWNNNPGYRTCEEMGQGSLKQWRSLIVVCGSPYRVDSSDFAKNVRKYNSLPPFEFDTNGKIKRYFSVYVSIYAAHLYDSVLLYAKALDQMIREKRETADPKVIDDLARNGKEITNTIIKMEGYQSVSGSYIHIDKYGDSQGNFTAFALKPYNYTVVSRITNRTTFSCQHYLVKVGEFYSENNEDGDNVITYAPKVNIDWPGHHKPTDEPRCGFDGSKCPGTKGRTEVAAGVLGGESRFKLVETVWRIVIYNFF